MHLHCIIRTVGLNWAPLVPGQPGTFDNPLSVLNMKSRNVTSNLIGNVMVSYSIVTGVGYQVKHRVYNHTSRSTFS